MGSKKVFSKNKEPIGFSGTTGYTSCYHSHPALKLTINGNEHCVWGGSAGFPKVTDADIYVSLCGSCSGHETDPWDSGKKVVEVHCNIPDMGVPKNVTRFKKLVTWLVQSIAVGKKVHVGCIGGHGRTGTLLSALVAEAGEKDAIQYVRKNYCDKAVESKAQVDFLMKEYGVSKVQGHKEGLFANAKGLLNGHGAKGYHIPLDQQDLDYYDGLFKSKAKSGYVPNRTGNVLPYERVDHQSSYGLASNKSRRTVPPMPNSPRSLFRKRKEVKLLTN
jgi:hypothetical protein